MIKVFLISSFAILNFFQSLPEKIGIANDYFFTTIMSDSNKYLYEEVYEKYLELEGDPEEMSSTYGSLLLREKTFRNLKNLQEAQDEEYHEFYILKEINKEDKKLRPEKLYRTIYDYEEYEGEYLPGVLYQSGIHYDEYQDQFKESVGTIDSINASLKETLSNVCLICKAKQQVPILTCPSACFKSN